MDNKEILLSNIDKVHTTKIGIDRIKRNLNLEIDDVVSWCVSIIKDKNCNIERRGKNWYVKLNQYLIIINAYSYTIITAHVK